MQAANNLATTVAFVIHRACPHTPAWPRQHIQNVQGWYENLQNWLTQRTKANPRGKGPSSITLWQAWEATQAKWDKFKRAFEVGQLWFEHGCMQCKLEPDPSSHAMQKNGRQWNKELARYCAKCVLRALMVGLHQPPMRLGSLQALHTCASLKEACVDCG